MANTSDSGSLDFNKASQDAYTEIVDSLAKDMPLIMHGSGDVPTWEVNPRSARILAQLTANYISNLVEAAVDSQEILNDGERPSLPPPPLMSKEKRRKAPLPSEYEWPPSILAKAAKVPTVASKKKKKTTKAEAAAATDTKDAAAKKVAATAAKPAAAVNKPNFGEKKKRKRRDVDYWDEPLPEPKIKNTSSSQSSSTEADCITFKGVPIGDWVGVAGVDFFEDSRIRDAHISAPAAVGAQNFIFPVCHDKHLYGKILEMQASRRSMGPILNDSVVLDVIRAEASLQAPFGSLRKRREREEKQKKTGGDATQESEDDEPEATDMEDELTRKAVWPGLDELLPMHHSALNL